MEAYLPFSFTLPTIKNSWFTHACSIAICNQEESFKEYKCLWSNEYRLLYIIVQNRSKPVFRLAKKHSIHSICNELSRSSSFSSSWHLAKQSFQQCHFYIFPFCSLVLMALLPPLLLKLSSLLKLRRYMDMMAYHQVSSLYV